MLVFQPMYAPGQCFGCVIFINRAAGLENYFSMVIFFIHHMNGDAAFFFLIGDYGFVYMLAIHTLAAIGRQECRVNINDPARVGTDQQSGNLPQKPGEYNKVNAGLFQFIYITMPFEEGFFFYY